jgi:hypothetical protein
LLESSHHFTNVWFKLKILTTNICQQEITIGCMHWLLLTFQLRNCT